MTDRINHNIEWITDENGNVDGYQRDAGVVVRFASLDQDGKLPLTNGLNVSGNSGSGNAAGAANCVVLNDVVIGSFGMGLGTIAFIANDVSLGLRGMLCLADGSVLLGSILGGQDANLKVYGMESKVNGGRPFLGGSSSGGAQIAGSSMRGGFSGYCSAVGDGALSQNIFNRYNTATGGHALYSCKGTSGVITSATQPGGTDGNVRFATSSTTGLSIGSTVSIWSDTDTIDVFLLYKEKLIVDISVDEWIEMAFVGDYAGEVALPATWVNEGEGTHNTANGFDCGPSITIGAKNTLGGSICGRKITTGNLNNLRGFYCGWNITTGSNNHIFGSNAAPTLTIGDGNLILGPADVPASDTTNYILLASGDGIKASFDTFNWRFVGRMKAAGFASNFTPNAASTYAVLATDSTVCCTAASTITLPDPTEAANAGRVLRIVTKTAGAVASDASNVVPLIGGAAGTVILAATAGKWADIQCDGSAWQVTAGN